MDARELDMAQRAAIAKKESDDLEKRVRKAWAENRDDPDFTLKACALRFRIHPDRVRRIVGLDAAKKAAPSPWRGR